MGRFESEVITFIQEAIKGTGFSITVPKAGSILLVNASIKSGYLLILKQIIYDEKSSRPVSDKAEFPESTKIISLWEDLWMFHRSKIESKLRSILGLSNRIHGRDTVIKIITNNDLLEFLQQNHLNVPIKAKYKYGLYYDKSLFAVMSFSKSRPIERNGVTYHSFELLRFCNKLDYTVVGGFSKLLRHFIRTMHPDDIMTYVDKDWSDGLTYEKAGFERVQILGPMEFLLNPATGVRIYPHRSEQETFFEDNAKSDLSFDLNIDTLKVYNSGSYKYILLLKK